VQLDLRVEFDGRVPAVRGEQIRFRNGVGPEVVRIANSRGRSRASITILVHGTTGWKRRSTCARG
jgi:hypothetical protein